MGSTCMFAPSSATRAISAASRIGAPSSRPPARPTVHALTRARCSTSRRGDGFCPWAATSFANPTSIVGAATANAPNRRAINDLLINLLPLLWRRGRKLVLVVGDAPDPILPKRPALRYGVKVANSAAAPRLNDLLTQRIHTVLCLLHAAGLCLGVELFGSRNIAERPERAPGGENGRVICFGQREGRFGAAQIDRPLQDDPSRGDVALGQQCIGACHEAGDLRHGARGLRGGGSFGRGRCSRHVARWRGVRSYVHHFARWLGGRQYDQKKQKAERRQGEPCQFDSPMAPHTVCPPALSAGPL